MKIRQLVALAALAIPVAAQVPADTVLVLESTPLIADYYKFVDVLGRGSTTVRDQNVFMPIASVAVDPSANAYYYFLGTGSSLPGTWRSEVNALADIGTTIWGPWSQASARRIKVGSNRIVTLDGNGNVEAFAKASGPAPLTLTIPQAIDIAILGDVLYTATNSGPGPAPVFENDLATNASRTVGTYPDATAIAVAPTGLELCVGTQTGDLLRIDTVSGTVTSTQVTNLGPIVAVGYTRFGTIVYTNGAELWSELMPTGPIYVSASMILDIGVAVATGPSVVQYGTGCGLGATANWTSTGLPSLGNSGFALGIEGATPLSPCFLTLGASRELWNAASQPLPFDLQTFGAPGCDLLADPQFTLLLFADSSGQTSQVIPIPPAPGLAGFEFVGQWFLLDPPSSTLGLASSEGAAFVIN